MVAATLSPNTVEADLARLALLGVRLLPMGDPNLELDRLFCSAEPILPTLLRLNMLDSEDILDSGFFFFDSGWSVSMSRLHNDTLSPSTASPSLLFNRFLFLKVNLVFRLGGAKKLSLSSVRKLSTSSSSIILSSVSPPSIFSSIILFSLSSFIFCTSFGGEFGKSTK